MTDLLDKFEFLLDNYRDAVDAWHDEINLAINIAEQGRSRNIAKNKAMALCNFLIEHDATVTFAEPSAPAAEASTHGGFVWDDERRNWFPVQTDGDHE